MARGDQIYVMRELTGIPGQYEHHGIDVGDGTVIHYRKAQDEATVSRTDYHTFSWGNRVYKKHHTASFLPDIVLDRAKSRLGEQKYDLFVNNCEHFATWCSTGRNESQQLANFGIRLDTGWLPQLRQLIAQTAQDRSPEQAIILFQKALGDIAVAYRSLQEDLTQAQQDRETWQQVAQLALDKHREDLARAALHRKVEAKHRIEDLQQHLADLVELQLTLEQNRELSERQYRLS